jgi:hypothetical protein
MMLSFNVSIEAARSGDASNGFAVIAFEIRKLASEVQTLSRDMHARVEQLMHSVTVDLENLEKQREVAGHDAIANVIRMLGGLSGSLSKLTAHERDIAEGRGRQYVNREPNHGHHGLDPVPGHHSTATRPIEADVGYGRRPDQIDRRYA